MRSRTSSTGDVAPCQPGTKKGTSSLRGLCLALEAGIWQMGPDDWTRWEIVQVVTRAGGHDQQCLALTSSRNVEARSDDLRRRLGVVVMTDSLMAHHDEDRNALSTVPRSPEGGYVNVLELGRRTGEN